MTATAKAKVTRRAVERRLATRLKKLHQELRRIDGKTALVDDIEGKILDPDVDVEYMARGMDVLRSWEEMS